MAASADGTDDFSAASGDYAEDDWGDSGDEWADSSDDWGDSSDDWGDSADASAQDDSAAQTAVEAKVWVDPNIQHAKDLQEQITVQKALEMFYNAYTAAGGKNATVEGMVKELERIFNYNGIDYYEVPYDLDKYPAATREGLANLVSQYLLLYSGSLDRFSDDQLAPKTIRMQVQLRCHDTHKIKEIIDAKSTFTDWLNNQIVRDQLKFDIKICLVKNGYPPQYSPEVFRKVMEQVDNFKGHSERDAGGERPLDYSRLAESSQNSAWSEYVATKGDSKENTDDGYNASK